MTTPCILRTALAFIAALLLSTGAQAQLFRAYLASDGSDTYPCTLSQPCRLLPAALAAVASGGEIWMLDSANYNTAQVNVTKSVTIIAIPGALGSVVATGGGDAININAAGIKVALRNLVIVQLSSSNHGVNFVQGAALDVAECEIANMANSGIYATAAGGKVALKNTVLRGSYIGFFANGKPPSTVCTARGTTLALLRAPAHTSRSATACCREIPPAPTPNPPVE